MQHHPLLVLLGPTASGKTKLAVALAELLDAEIISADSRQIFRGMDIGTGKDLAEYQIHGQQIPYHLINIKDAGTLYNVNEFKDDFYRAFEGITRRKKLPLLCGGTGMYIHALLQEHHYTAIPTNEKLRSELELIETALLQRMLLDYPLELRSQADYSSRKRMIRAVEIAEYLQHQELIVPDRPLMQPFVIGLTSDVELRRKRIVQRLELRLQEGMIEEVKSLVAGGLSKEMLNFYGLEYKLIGAYLFGEINYAMLRERLEIEIRQFAKRQMTFFRKMEKDGVVIHWFNTDENPDKLLLSVFNLYRQEINL
jgi:tRNA dimethylallyltransferase